MTEFDTHIPIYLQIIYNIKQSIVSGTLKPGDKLASVRDFAESLSVNPNTVQRAYQELEREGVSETKRGTGTFIVEKQTLISALRSEMAKSVLHTFIEGMHAIGFTDDMIMQTLEKELKTSSTGGKL